MQNNYMNPFGYYSMPTATQPYGMPMSPYFNAFNQPQSQNQQNTQQPTNTTPQQPQQPMNTNKIFVTGIEDVRNRMLPLNSKFIFVDNDKDLLYEKIVDNTGHFEVKTYEICEKKGTDSGEDVKVDKIHGYATKSDLEPLQTEIKALKDKLTKIYVSNQIDAIKKEGVSDGTSGTN